VRACARKAFENSKRATVQPFGSLVSGLSTWASDVDLVVTGLVRERGGVF
jgi:DNA polymerase sigma